MHALSFYIETEKYARIKKLLIVGSILPGAYVFFVLLLKIMGEHGSFVRKCTWIAIPVGAIFLGLVITSIVVYFQNRSHCKAQVFNDGSIEINIEHKNGSAHRAHGFWSLDAVYTKTYYKYGMYHKHLQLILYCNEVIYGIFRQEVAPANSVPHGFRQVSSNVGGAPVYFTRETLTLFGFINSVNQQRYANPLQQYALWKQANTQQTNWRTGNSN